ncbi:hypothetical protein BT69DRAFT_1072036 [Atractiella rhizophila]|nr:hypothetical protein BT69DRAFT_1072036 [Atractiella rhizophila]
MSINTRYLSLYLPKLRLGNVTGLYEVHGGVEEGLDHAHEELFKVVPEVSVAHLAYTLLSAFTVFFGMFSALVKERLFFGEPIIATGLGIVFSETVADIFAPRTWNGGGDFNEVTLEIMRIVIALSVFAVGVELPKSYVLKHWKSLSILLGPNMLFGWMVSGALIYVIIPKLTFLESLVVAAAVTPTDPVLAASVVGRGKFAQEHVPSHLRHLLQCESGSNDGAAFPFLFLALFLLLREDVSVGDTIGQWILLVLLYQIILGTFIGAFIGVMARKIMKFSKRRGLIDRESMVAMYVALALFTTGVTTLAGSDDLLASFACGVAFAWDDWFSESIEDSNFANIIDLLVNCATFVYIGATMPFPAWDDPLLSLTPWRLVLLAIAILVLRRLPFILLFYNFMPDIKTFREAVFSGHFGPMGVGAIFIATLATERLPTPLYPPETSLDVLALTIQPIVYFLVLSSVLVHGLTIPFFSVGKRLHSRVHSISRTWTQASGGPAWLSHARKVDRPDDIVVNRDDSDLEKGKRRISDIIEEESEDSNTPPLIRRTVSQRRLQSIQKWPQDSPQDSPQEGEGLRRC